jgi:HK97 family phage portal protein
VRGATLPGDIVGMSPVTYCRNVIGTGLALEEFSGRWFSQGSAPSGIIETQQASGDLDAGMLRDEFEKFHRGVAKSHGVAVLTGGATYKPITVSNKDSQFLEAKNFSASQIATCMFQLEPEMVGASMTGRTSLTYKNLQDRWLDVKLRALMPYTSRLEEMLTMKLLPRPQRACLNYEEYLRADIGERYTAYQVGIASGFLTVDEVRAEEDLPPLGSPETEPALPDALPSGEPIPTVATPPEGGGVN